MKTVFSSVQTVKKGYLARVAALRLSGGISACFAAAFGLGLFMPLSQALEIPAAPDLLQGAPAAILQGQDAPANDAHASSEAFENGRVAYHSGRKDEAVTALQFAASQGHTGAQWMLGRMFAEGDGVTHDDMKAFEYFKGIVQSFSSDPDSYESHRNAPYVSSALVWLGSYYLEGIPGTGVKPQPKLALRLFTHAAYNYGDPNAQYDLARMYLEGNGVKKDPSQAIKWLNLASQKNHPPSQALLGHMLFTGQSVHRQPAKGLALMALARRQVEDYNNPANQWIIDLHNNALEQNLHDQEGNSATERWIKIER
jgi:uncharacterized protein